MTLRAHGAWQHERRRRRTRGVVSLELALALVPLIVLFLGLLQLALILCARVVVRHAAARAARSAVVVLDDDPERYGRVERGDVSASDAAPISSSAGPLEPALERVGATDTAPLLDQDASGNARLAAIRAAAYMPLATLAPPTATLSRAFGIAPVGSTGYGHALRFVAGALLYAPAAAAVTLRDGPGGARTHTVASDADVTVRVAYLYHCGLPLADRLLCDALLEPSDLAGLDASSLSELARGPAGAVRRLLARRSSGRRPSLDEVFEHAATPELLLPLALRGSRFRLLTAEATLPNQGACYYAGSSCFRGAGGAP